MNEEMHGKKIKSIWWCGHDGDATVRAGNGTELELHYSYHGDRDESWVVQLKDGFEVARHNCRTISTITWLDDNEGEKS